MAKSGPRSQIRCGVDNRPYPIRWGLLTVWYHYRILLGGRPTGGGGPPPNRAWKKPPELDCGGSGLKARRALAAAAKAESRSRSLLVLSIIWRSVLINA